LQGKVALSLSTNIEVHMKKPGYATKYLMEFTQILISQWKKAWMERIKISQKDNSDGLHQTTKMQNVEKLRYLYSNKEYLNDNFTKVMAENISEHMKQSNYQISAWLSVHYESLKIQIQIRKQREDKDETLRLDSRIPCEARDGNPDNK
jgi:hypothetical protein